MNLFKSRKLIYMLVTIVGMIAVGIASRYINKEIAKEIAFWLGTMGTAAISGQSIKDFSDNKKS